LENALKHSGIGLREGAHADFVLEQENDNLLVTVSNSKMSARVADEPGGIGLENIRKRLQRLPAGHAMEISESETLFIVKLIIPFA
jgi:LytS/YehU family sensor histidine kinase